MAPKISGFQYLFFFEMEECGGDKKMAKFGFDRSLFDSVSKIDLVFLKIILIVKVLDYEYNFYSLI